jgi:hypothetical protein
LKYDSFVDFMEREALPRQAANPDHVRLDGQLSGGNPTEVCQFVHDGRLWRIHADTRYEPLKLAYHALKAGSEPFREASTKTRKRLDLRPIVQRLGSRHMYIYEVVPKS